MKVLKYIFLLFFICLITETASAKSKANDSILRIIAVGKSDTWSKSDLISHPALTHLTIDNDRAYPNQLIEHQAIPLCQLLSSYQIREQDFVELISKDNFHVYVPSAKIMDCRKSASIAMLAIEPASKWPVIDNHTGTTAGPYEVIWLNPERSYISNEYWAWSVVAIKITEKLDYKKVLAPPKTTKSSLINGYQLYISHCEGCHSINHIGKSTIGPDLNCPKNPLEYYPELSQLKKFIRDPKSLRSLPQGRMSGSDIKSLSDNDLSALIEFFSYMNTNKKC